MAFPMQGEVAVVTGAARGIGRATAEAMAYARRTEAPAPADDAGTDRAGIRTG